MSSEQYNSSAKIDTSTNVENDKTIPIEALIQLFQVGFRKMVPLFADSKRANVYSDKFITEEEIKQFPSAEGKHLRIIHQNPCFWTETRLQENSHLFHNVATTFGLTDLKDSRGRALYLYGVDIDTKQAYEVLKEIIEKLKEITIVVKSHKEYGYHFYILTPVLHEPLGQINFVKGAEIEVKTDMSLGTMHLPPSRHRSYPYWNYAQIGTTKSIYIDEEDTVYQEIIQAMSGYLRKKPTEENILTLDAHLNPPRSNGAIPTQEITNHQQQHQQHLQPNRTLTDDKIDKVIDIIIDESKSYVEYSRNDFVYGLSGHLFHNSISESTAAKLVSKLCEHASDEEADERYDVVVETYKKGKAGKPIKGVSQLRYLLAKFNDENDVQVNKIMAELNEALKIVHTRANTYGDSSNSSGTNNPSGIPLLGRTDLISETMVNLSESNGDIFFKDTFGQPYAVIKLGGDSSSNDHHFEVISMDKQNFKYHLRMMLKHNTEQRIVSNDSIEKAIETLKADAIIEGRTIPLHLRVAWKKKNEVIYFDPTNEKWSCIAIERYTGTWRLLPAGSLTGYPTTELRKKYSQLKEQPILFTRYSQTPQVLPERNYPLDIMQQFIDRCTNIRDPKDQLLFKAYIITLFIPDIAHVILLLKGVKGAAKSIVETQVKRIIDPSQIELLILNNDKREFIIQLAHNYYNAYDNVIKIPRWLSSIICAATTGAGFIMRTLYTTADETALKFKRCFALSSIGASLTEDDALERSISLKSPKIEKQNRKLEDKVLAEFDSMLPQLLGYIFDTLAKTMQIKDQLEQSGELDGKLERMADFSFWSEAAARAMGYKPMEFLDAYSENLRNQSREAVNFNALADIMRIICQNELAKKSVVEYTLPILLEKVRQTGFEIGIEIDKYTTKFAWAKTPQSLSEELMRLAGVIEDSYGYKIERYLDTVGRRGRKKNNSVIRITNPDIKSEPKNRRSANK
jgi:hypothetical protein